MLFGPTATPLTCLSVRLALPSAVIPVPEIFHTTVTGVDCESLLASNSTPVAPESILQIAVTPLALA